VDAPTIDITKPASPELQNKLIHAYGKITTDKPVGDNKFLKPGNFVALKRITSMYAWDESKSTTSSGDRKRTTYSYSKRWTTKPKDSSSFRHSNEHKNPPKSIDNLFITPEKATIGNFNIINLKNIETLDLEPLKLTTENLILSIPPEIFTSEFVFKGNGTPDNPVIGDIKIFYKVLKANNSYSVFGLLSQDNIMAYEVKKKNIKLFHIIEGNKNDALQALKEYYTKELWKGRLAGTAMMVIGSVLLLGPVFFFLNLIPVIGDELGCLLFIALIIVSIVLSGGIIAIAMIAYNLVSFLLAFIGTLLLLALTIILPAILIHKKNK